MQTEGFQIRDGSISPAPFALPAVAGTSSTSNAIDTTTIGSGDFLAECELLITAPALNTTQLPDGQVVTYSILQSLDNVNFTTLDASTLVQTGAGGAGAATATARFRLPTNCQRYIALQATISGSAGDCSGVNAQLDLLF